MTTTPTNDHDGVKEQLRVLGLWGLHAHFDEVAAQPWLPSVIRYEQGERQRRSLQRRLRHAVLGSFKSMADFDWSWPKKLDRELVEELMQLQFIAGGINVILVGPNGVGKTTVAKNLTHQAVVHGYTARFTTASDMLNDLAAQDSDASLARRLRRYCRPNVLAIDEVGYLSYDARYADLLFEVVTRRYNEGRPIILTTNKPFAEWTQVFPNAACVVTLVDRLVHRSEIIVLQGDSYRLHEASERSRQRAEKRKEQKTKSKAKKPPAGRGKS
jgi:DNA replication protein DnaC